MTKTLHATTADVILAFQTMAGVDPDSLINAGEATITGGTKPLKPQGKGYYGLKMSPGDSCELNLLGTSFNIQYQPDEINETSAKDAVTITSWRKLGSIDKSKPAGIQRRLQLLGYYTGTVDGAMGRKTEHAILRFQADYKLRTDGLVGPKTSAKLDEVIEKKNKTGDDFYVRRQLVRFTRAPSKDKPEVWSGRPFPKAPDPDDRGFVEVEAARIKDISGTVVSMARNTDFRVKVVREHLDRDAELTAVSRNESLVEVLTPGLPKEREAILRLKAGKGGKKPEETVIDIKLKSGGNEYVVGSLTVIVFPVKTVQVRPYMVTICDSAGGSPTAPADNQATWNKVFNAANRVWWPYGFYFNILSWRQKTVNLSTAGRLSKSAAGTRRSEFNDIINANDSAGNASEHDVVNLLVVNSIEGAIGVTYPAVVYSWPNGVAIAMSARGADSTGIDLAHEFGHFLSLSDLLHAKRYIHAEDDPDRNNQKKDIWSIRKLMFGNWPSVRSDSWAQNVGYGNGQYGCMVTMKNLPGDKTDNEWAIATKHFGSADFYYGP